MNTNIDGPKTPLQELLLRDVSRKEFIATLGLGALSIFGLSTIIRFLTGHHMSAGRQESQSGYGSSAYGK